ncbi:MAG: hypothetical protein Q9221_002931 [Calogaya cf. arnoldii]
MRILAKGDRFIPDLLRQTYQGWVEGQVLDVLVTVVDRISPPLSTVRKADTAVLSTPGGELHYNGKGISALLTDMETAAPDLWSQPEGRKGESTSTIPRRSTLSFQFGPNKESIQPAKNNAEDPSPKSFQSKIIKLPVANTIFHNGRESTIQAQRWIVGETMLEPTLACIERSWLHEQVLRVAFPFPLEPHKAPLQVTVPMTRISLPQRVATSMGNVIRRLFPVETPSKAAQLDISSEPEPASKQLECAVTDWRAEPGNEMRAVEVWALVRPPGTLQRFRYSNFSKIIKAGGHFHKVLSGGGGWGNRQGLLALDPEVDFDVAPELMMVQDFDNVGSEAEGGNLSSQIVNTGDIVEFFARDLIEASSTATPESKRSHYIRCQPCLIFGTTPSTVDAMPERSRMMQHPPSSSDCIFIPAHFGMLSEQGVSLTTISIDGEVSRTKIDVPHALLSCGLTQKLAHSFPLEVEPSAEDERTPEFKVTHVPNMKFRRVHLDNPTTDTAPENMKFRRVRLDNPTTDTAPELRSEYVTPGPGD